MKFSLSGELLLKRFAKSLERDLGFVAWAAACSRCQFDPARGVVPLVGHGQSPPPTPDALDPLSRCVGVGASGCYVARCGSDTASVGAGIASPRIIGRDEELAALESALRDASAGRPSVVILAGPSGVGKSRLVAEFAEMARSSGGRALAGDCLEVVGGGLPFGPLIAILRDVAREIPADRLAAILGPARPTLAALVPELRGAGRDDSAATDGAAADGGAADGGAVGTAADRAAANVAAADTPARPPASSSTSSACSGALPPMRRPSWCSKTCSGSIRRHATW